MQPYSSDELLAKFASGPSTEEGSRGGYAPTAAYSTDELLAKFSKPQTTAAPTPTAEEGDTLRGIEVSLGQTPALFKGLMGLIGATGESMAGEGGFFTGMKEWGLKGYETAMGKVAARQKETDSPTEAWKRAKEGDYGALIDMAQYGVGYGIGQLGESALVALGGAVIGGMGGAGIGAAPGAVAGVVGKNTVKSMLTGLVEKAVAKRAETMMATDAMKKVALESGEDVAKGMARTAATKQVAQAMGATAASGGFNIMMEGGSIYPEAAEEAKAKGEKLDGADIARIWGSTFAAAGMETVSDMFAGGQALGIIKNIGKTSAGKVALGAAGGFAREAGTEAVQTGIERFGAQQEIFSDQGIKDIIDSAVMGGIGGGAFGGVSGVLGALRARQEQKALEKKQAGEDLEKAETFEGAMDAFKRTLQPISPSDDPTTLIREAPGDDLAAAIDEAGLATKAYHQQTAKVLGEETFVAPRDIGDYLDSTSDQGVIRNLLSADEASANAVMDAMPAERKAAVLQALSNTLKSLDEDSLRAAGGYVAEVALQHRQEQAKTVGVEEAYARQAAQAERLKAGELERGVLEPTRDIEVERAALLSELAGVNAGTPTALAHALAAATPDKRAQIREQQVRLARMQQAARGAAQTRAEQLAAEEAGTAFSGTRVSPARENLPTGAEITSLEAAAGMPEAAAAPVTPAPAAGKAPVTERVLGKETPVEERGHGTIAGKPAAELSDAELIEQAKTATGATRNAISHELRTRGIPHELTKAAPAEAIEQDVTPEGQRIAGSLTRQAGEKVVARAVSTADVGKVQAKVPVAEARAAEIIAGLFKKKVQWFQAQHENGERSGVGGFVRDDAPGTLYLNLDSLESVVSVVAHEILHMLKTEHADAYRVIRDIVHADFKAHPEKFEKFRAYYGKEGMADEALLEEAIADALGNQARDKGFWVNVFAKIADKHGITKAKGIIQRLRDAIVRLLAHAVDSLPEREGFKTFITNAEQIATALEDATASYLEALREGKTRPADAMAFSPTRIGPYESRRGAELSQRFQPKATELVEEGGKFYLEVTGEKPAEAKGPAAPAAAGPSRGAQPVREEPRGAHRAETPGYGEEGRPNSIAVTGTHYSSTQRDSLSGWYYGTGLAGEEADRLKDAPPDLQKRIYFYVDTGQGVQPEAGVGSNAHETKLNNIYDLEADPLNLVQRDRNAMESAILAAGFDGYLNRNFTPRQGAVVLLGERHDAVPTKQVGTGPQAATGRTLPAAEIPKARQLAKELNQDRGLPAGELPAKRWGRILEAAHPEIHAALEAAGVFSADTPMYKGELASEYLRLQKAPATRASAARVRGPDTTLATRVPTSKVIEAPDVTQALLADFPTLESEPDLLENIVNAIGQEPGMAVDPNLSVEEQAAVQIERMKENLLWLFDRIPKEIRERSKLWYEGAERIARAWSERYNITRSQAAGVLAVLSPQKDWFMNVTLAERILDIATHQGDHPFDKHMDAAAFGFLTAEALKEDSRNLAAYEIARTKTLNELLEAKQFREAALWVRAYDEAYHPGEHAVVTPEGGFGALKTVASGESTVRAWGGFDTIAKALSVYENGSAENISEQLGGEHKVRNFYNNIYAPGDPRYATIDTHAVAAALIRALSGKSKAVTDNFGGTGSRAATGLSGSYPFYFEAYKQAAEARGVLPREMQSITWEAVRGLFTEGFKGKDVNVEAIDALWRRVDAGELTREQARVAAEERGGGIDNPDWINDAPGSETVLHDKSYVRERPAFRGNTMTFEVAPDPRNKELSARWNALPAAAQESITSKVIWRTVAKALASFADTNLKGALVRQRGGYRKDSNVSYSIQFNKRASGTKIGALLRMVGSALRQQEMIRTSPKSFKNFRGEKAEKVGTILVKIPSDFTDAQVDALYNELRTLKKGNKVLVDGHTTAEGAMVIFNKKEWSGLDDKALTELIGEKLDGRYDVLHGDDLYVEFAKKGGDDYGLRVQKGQAGGDSAEPSIRERANQLRAETDGVLGNLIGEAEQGRYSAARRTEEAPAERVTKGPQRELFPPLTNSEGRPVHPTKEGVRNFWNWFEGSEVVDKEGRPLVVYHGTAQDLAGGAFERALATSEGGAFYFSHSPQMKNPAYNANLYAKGRAGEAPNVIPVYLSLQNPLVTGFTEAEPENPADVPAWLDRMEKFNRRLDMTKEKYYRQAIREARQSGNDGVIIRGIEDVLDNVVGRFVEPTDVYVAFQPQQIKSATGNLGTFSPVEAAINFSPKRTIEVDGQERPATNSEGRPIYPTEEGIRNFWKWFGDSASVDRSGRPQVLIHGTTADFTQFERRFGTPEGDMGAGFYFSNTSGDVAANYAGEGPDLSRKIEALAERIMNEAEDSGDELTQEQAEQIARERFSQHSGLTMPVYLQVKNPVRLGGFRETNFDYQLDEDENESGRLLDFTTALWDQRNRYDDADIDALITEIYEAFPDGADASELIRFVKGSENIAYATDKEGRLVSTEIIRQALEDMGFDGVIDETVDVKFGSQVRLGKPMAGMHRGTVHTIVFQPTQIKSALGNGGSFSKEEADIRFSRPRIPGVSPTWGLAPPVDPKALEKLFKNPMDRARWRAAGRTVLDWIIYKLQDKHKDLKAVVKAIGTVADKWNPYLQETLFHGRAAKATQDFLNHELRPLLEELQARGISTDDFEEFLHNRHAEERNDQIARVNPVFDPASPQFGGVEGSGINTRDARNYLAALAPDRRRAMDALAARVDRINAGTRKALVDYGLESQKTINAWEGVYKQYVPLERDMDDDFSLEGGPGTGAGFSVSGSASKRATGSGRPVVNILANLAMQRERTITRGEKNRVAMAMYGLALQSPNPDFWAPIKPGGNPAVMQQTLLDLGVNPLLAANAAQTPTVPTVSKTTGLVINRPDMALLQAANAIVTRVNGENRYLILNGRDPNAARLAASLKNLDVKDVGPFLGAFRAGSRWFASVNTQYNPIFGVVNFVRDVQEATLNLTNTPLAGKQKAIVQDTPKALVEIFKALRLEQKGQPVTSHWGKLWEEFQAEGGQTGYREAFATSEDRAKEIEKELKRLAHGPLLQRSKAVFGLLSDYNEAMENAVRLSSYAQAKASGMSNSKAADLAKNLTVNFNRKGQLASQAGALYAFFNASAQGAAVMVRTLSSPAGKKIMAGGLLLGAVQAVALAAAGMGDDKIPDFVKERNLILPIIGTDGFVTIPMPLGYNLIPNAGRLMMETVLGGGKDAGKNIYKMVGLMFEAFNPIGTSATLAQTLTPTLADPLIALAENKDWTGKPIAKQDFNALAPTPGFTRAKDTATTLSKKLSEFFNWASGGTDFKPGIFSPTPDQIDYLFGQLGGGVARELAKTEQSIMAPIHGETLPASKIPLFGRFYGETKGQVPEGGRFYENVKAVNEHEQEIKGRRKAGEPLGNYIAENPEAMLVAEGNAAEKRVSALNKQKRELIKMDAPRERIRLIEEQITATMARFNQRVELARETAH